MYAGSGGDDDDTVLPVYYGNLCAKMLPTLDIVFGRCLECDRPDLVLQLVKSFRKLYHVRRLTYFVTIDFLFLFFNGLIFHNYNLFEKFSYS